jgi:hypothetical protein
MHDPLMRCPADVVVLGGGFAICRAMLGMSDRFEFALQELRAIPMFKQLMIRHFMAPTDRLLREGRTGAMTRVMMAFAASIGCGPMMGMSRLPGVALAMADTRSAAAVSL